jgi:hypothetical protein
MRRRRWGPRVEALSEGVARFAVLALDEGDRLPVDGGGLLAGGREAPRGHVGRGEGADEVGLACGSNGADVVVTRKSRLDRVGLLAGGQRGPG